ncbi:MAG: hypothetical protein AAF292_05200 [Pseudomonadota bacterium]
MRFQLLAFALFAACSGQDSTNRAGSSSDRELHVVSVYEGFDQVGADYSACQYECRRAPAVGPADCLKSCVHPASVPRRDIQAVIPIELDRPGRAVTLVLGAYDPIEWRVSKTRSTRIEQIILIGHRADKSSAFVNEALRGDVVRQRMVQAPYDREGRDFRHIAEALPLGFGFDRIDSFQGSYEAPLYGFAVTGPQPNIAELDPDYLANIQKAMREDDPLIIQGVIGGQTGSFRMNGEVVDNSQLVRKNTRDFAANQPRGYEWTPEGVRVFNTETNQVIQSLGKPSDIFNVGHFSALVLDEKRSRLLVAFQAGAAASDILALDLETGNWSSFSSTDRTRPNSLFYDATNDRFLVSGTKFSMRAFIGQIAPNGSYDDLYEIGYQEFPGLSDLFDPGNEGMPNMYIIGLDGYRVAIASDGNDIFDRQKGMGPLKRIYSVDLRSGDAELMYYQ